VTSDKPIDAAVQEAIEKGITKAMALLEMKFETN
jgi:hypothetical protein